MAMRVAVSELVASLMAESDGKKKGKPCFGGKRGGNYSWRKLSKRFSHHGLAAAEVSTFDGSFLGRKGCKHLG